MGRMMDRDLAETERKMVDVYGVVTNDSHAFLIQALLRAHAEIRTLKQETAANSPMRSASP